MGKMMMKHLTVGVFGDKEFMKKLGKPGTVNDIMMYNHSSSEGVYSFASPNSAEKIQPILQVINMIDVPVIVAEEITKELAEQVIFLDALGFEKGFVISQSDSLKNLIKGTTLENYELVPGETELRQKLSLLEPKMITNNVWMPIDNYFNVKSVGTVVLTISKGTALKKYDKLLVQPTGKEVMIKGIQSQDKDIEETEPGMRAGLNLKGIDAEELKRGYVVCKTSPVSKTVTVSFNKSRYSKEQMEKGLQVFLSVGLQVVTGKIAEFTGSSVSIMLEQPVAFFQNQKCIIASTKQTMPRILGSGTINY
jgi:selenocysteine-specific translation elongation factor